MNIRYNHVLSLFLLSLSLCLQAAIVIEGDTSGTASFTFAIGAYARGGPGGTFYVGALNAGDSNNFSIARNIEGQLKFEPFAPATATINGVADQPNPLFNGAITQLSTFRTLLGANRLMLLPMAVTAALPASLFLVRDVPTTTAFMLAVPSVKDVQNQTTTGIIGLQSFLQEAIFTAVLPSGSSTFGDPDSGIAVVKVENITVDEKAQAVLVQINADPNTLLPETDPAASPLDRTSMSLKINNDLFNIDNALDMHYSERLQRLYVALSVQGGPNPSDGARAIAVGQLNNNKLTFFQIAPDAVFTDSDEIVGGVGASAQVSIHKVRTMYTSTKLDYLIVVGGNGSPATTQRSVYALPLVNRLATESVDNAIQGTLANVDDAPIDIYTPAPQNTCNQSSPQLRARAFVTAATEPGQIYVNSSPEASVGGGQLPYGDITDINVYSDAVFVSVADTINNELPGIFYSQALFDDNGVIISWTPWQRVAGTTDPVYALSYQSMFGDLFWLTGQMASTINTAKQTTWGLGSSTGLADLVTLVSTLFDQCAGGVQGFFDLPSNSPGLFDISMFIATGLNQVLLVESGQVTGGVLEPNGGDFSTDLQEFTDGQITTNFPIPNVKTVSISGGVLSDIGPIIAATLGVNSDIDQGYLFVGGAGGLAVLAQPDGSGWSTLTGLGKEFDGLVSGMQFIALGDYSFVRKLIFDNGFLYVLTDTQLDRIDIAASDFATNTLSVVTVATLSDVAQTTVGTLLDVLISGKFALIGTSTGLWRVGNGADIRTATDSADVGWTKVVIPEGVPVVQYMQAISDSSMASSWAQGVGNVYVNDGYRGFDWAQVNRYTVADVETDPIGNNTLLPLPDIIVQNILTSFRTFSGFRNIIMYDGADLFSMRDRFQITPPTVYDWTFALPLDIAKGSIVSSMVRSSASGAWIVSGDFGLRVNE